MVAVVVFPPHPSLLFPQPSLLRSWGVCGCGSWPCRVVALWWSPSPVPVLALLVPVLPPPFVWVSLFLFLLFRCPCGCRPATSPAGVCAGVSGVSFPPALRRLCGRGGPLFLVGCLLAGQGGAPQSYRRGPRVLFLLLPGWGVACLSGVGARLRGCAAVPPAFLLSRRPAGVRSLVAGASPILFFFWRGVCLFLSLPSLGWCTHCWANGVASRVAVGVVGGRRPAPAPCVALFMSTHWLVARPVRLGSGSAGWADVRAGSVRSLVTGWGCPLFPRPCGVGLVVAGFTFRWRFVRGGGRRRRGGGLY